MRFKTLFSDLRKRKKIMAYARAFGFEGHVKPLGDGCAIVSLDRDHELSQATGLDIVSIGDNRPQPPKWLASAVVIASIFAFFALMFAISPHR